MKYGFFHLLIFCAPNLAVGSRVPKEEEMYKVFSLLLVDSVTHSQKTCGVRCIEGIWIRYQNHPERLLLNVKDGLSTTDVLFKGDSECSLKGLPLNIK